MQMLASTVLSVNEDIFTYRSQVHSTVNSLKYHLFSDQVDDLLKRVEYVENDWNVLVGAPRRSFQLHF